MRKSVKIIGIGSLVLVGGFLALGAAQSGSSTAAAPAAAAPAAVTEAPVTITEAAPAPVTVTVTAPAPAPVTVTAAPAAPAAGKAPGEAKRNGNYLIGSQIEMGTWQCDAPSAMPYWSVKSESNDLLDNGIESIATIAEGFKAELSGCDSVWTKV